MSDFPTDETRECALTAGWKVFLDKKWLILCLSALIVVPCLWHRRIEAGDLGSHVYNAWLAQLIAKGQAPGLYIAKQWSNILFDISLLHVATLFGLVVAEKIVVSACVLVFFWGVFAFISAVTGQAPWFLVPCIAMLSYGYSFNMGFFNYYLSIGLACFCLALVWRGWALNWLPWVFAAPLVFLAHPLGVAWFVSAAAYRSTRRLTSGWGKLVPLVAVVLVLVALRFYLQGRTDWDAHWISVPFYALNGADQLALYGHRYITLGQTMLVFGVICFLIEVVGRSKEPRLSESMALTLELYLLLFLVTALLPEELGPPVYAGRIGLLVSRLTIISAILGLCVLGHLKPRKWHLLGFAAGAAVFFLFLYQDTGILNRTESNAEIVVSVMPYGTRIIPMIAPQWRIKVTGHLADRACIGHCFTYSNYEAPSEQFRVRVKKGSPIMTDSYLDSMQMQSGTYVIRDTDLPLKYLYQCDPEDKTKVCLRELAKGESTGRSDR